MRVRHKTPTLVSMWMLDVFCCALGCVTLLWLLNTRQAGDQTAAAKSALTDLAATRSDLLSAETKLKLALTNLDSAKLRLNSEITQLTTQLGAVRAEKADLARKLGIARDEAKSAQALLDATKVALTATETKLDATAKDLAAARDKAAAADDSLRKRQKEADALAKKATDAATAAADLAKLLRKKDEDLAAVTTRAADLQKTLDDVTARLATSKKESTKSADDLAAARAAAKKAEDALAKMAAAGGKTDEALASANKQIKDLSKKVDDANATIIDLQGDKAKLADKVNQVERANESRFAGIATTGRSAIFVVDMSGSMDKIDLNTPAPHKWPVVCETVAKVMRSIPTLTQYQVIVFSKHARWLSGDGAWQRFDGEKTATAVKDALLRVKPEGDTNMHAAFDLAFTLRTRGLDTIYLFSDGLPTSGPGLTPAQETTLDEQKRGEILAKHIRDKLVNTWNRRLVGDDRVKIHAVGFFFESPDVGAFLWALARDNGGSFVGMSRP
jgi:hypothetical protein